MPIFSVALGIETPLVLDEYTMKNWEAWAFCLLWKMIGHELSSRKSKQEEHKEKPLKTKQWFVPKVSKNNFEGIVSLQLEVVSRSPSKRDDDVVTVVDMHHSSFDHDDSLEDMPSLVDVFSIAKEISKLLLRVTLFLLRSKLLLRVLLFLLQWIIVRVLCLHKLKLFTTLLLRRCWCCCCDCGCASYFGFLSWW